MGSERVKQGRVRALQGGQKMRRVYQGAQRARRTAQAHLGAPERLPGVGQASAGAGAAPAAGVHPTVGERASVVELGFSGQLHLRTVRAAPAASVVCLVLRLT